MFETTKWLPLGCYLVCTPQTLNLMIHWLFWVKCHHLYLFLCLQTTTWTLEILVEISSWNNPPRQDMVHLNCRSRWIPPNEEGVYPVTFECPYRECLQTFSAAQDCSMHVDMVKHPKTNQGEGKNWLCAGTITGKTRFQGAKKVRFIACHSASCS